MRELFCTVCGRPFIGHRVSYCCKECRKGRMKIQHKEPVAEPKKIPTVNHKQCRTCKYQAAGVSKRNGMYCAYQEITGVSKIVAYPDCKAPPYCPAYKKGRRLKSNVRCTM